MTLKDYKNYIEGYEYGKKCCRQEEREKIIKKIEIFINDAIKSNDMYRFDSEELFSFLIHELKRDE